VLKELYNSTVDYLLVTFDANFIFFTMLLTTAVSIVYFIVISYIITQMDTRYFIIQKNVIDNLNNKGDLPSKNLSKVSCEKVAKKLLINHTVNYVIKTAKIIMGIFLLLCGILMLVLPGQGLITMLIGLSLIPFPGKHKFEQNLLARKSIRSTLNWIRVKAKKDPFIFD
jgi:hypothetical protein